MVRQRLFNKRNRIKNVVLITLCTALIGTNTGVIEAGTLNAPGTMTGTAVCTDNVTGGCTEEPQKYSTFSDSEDEDTVVISFKRGETASENNGAIGYCVVGEKVPVTPYFTSRSKIKVVSGYEGMAKINKRGILVGRKPGTVKITDGSVEKSIVILKPQLKFETIDSLDVVASENTIRSLNYISDNNATLSGAELLPDEWKSSNERVAIINSKTGEIIPLKKGTTTITASFGKNKNAAKISAKLKVNVPFFNKSAVSLKVSGTKKIRVKGIRPKDTEISWKVIDSETLTFDNPVSSDKVPLSWNSAGNNDVAVVDDDGYVTGVQTGRCTLAAYINEGGKITVLTCRVYVGLEENESYTIQLENGSTAVKGHFDFAMTDEVYEKVNNYRKAEGFGKLTPFDDLDTTAMTRAVELSYQTSHDRPNDNECFTAYPNVGKAGENIAAGYKSAEQLFKAWKKSAGHNANMLNKDYTHAGMAVFVTNAKNNNGMSYKYYAVQCFTDELKASEQ